MTEVFTGRSPYRLVPRWIMPVELSQALTVLVVEVQHALEARGSKPAGPVTFPARRAEVSLRGQ
jgi:hypothetical protein